MEPLVVEFTEELLLDIPLNAFHPSAEVQNFFRRIASRRRFSPFLRRDQEPPLPRTADTAEGYTIP
jgi:hypothetical protein